MPHRSGSRRRRQRPVPRRADNSGFLSMRTVRVLVVAAILLVPAWIMYGGVRTLWPAGGPQSADGTGGGGGGASGDTSAWGWDRSASTNSFAVDSKQPPAAPAHTPAAPRPRLPTTAMGGSTTALRGADSPPTQAPVAVAAPAVAAAQPIPSPDTATAPLPVAPSPPSPPPSTLFPPGATADGSIGSVPPVNAGRSVLNSEHWAVSQLTPLLNKYQDILGDYPPHMQALVSQMPAHRFAEIKNARLHYVGEAPVAPKADPKGTRSTFQLSTRAGSNSATGTNMCFDKKANKIILYKGGGRSIRSENDVHLMTKLGQAGFKWTWKVEENSGSVPDRSSAEWLDGFTALFSPPFSRHITHFSESVTFLFHANLHPRIYPWWAETKQVLHVKIKSTDFGWSKDFMKATMSALPDPSKVRLLWADMLPGRRTNLICFERAGLVAQQTHEFGYHADPWEAQVFREAAFKMFDVPEPKRPTPQQPARTLVLDRKGRKKMTNGKELVDVIQQTELGTFDYMRETASQPVFFEDTSFKHQISVMRQTDILIGLHGSGLNNAMFMGPGSVVIAIMPSNYIEYEWHNFITGSGSTYMIQTNTDNSKHSANCKKYPPACASIRPFQAKKSECVPMWYCDGKVDVGATEALYRAATFLVRNMKREIVKGPHAYEFGTGRNPAGKVLDLKPL